MKQKEEKSDMTSETSEESVPDELEMSMSEDEHTTETEDFDEEDVVQCMII